jgi:KUP system potassium uptake protein
VILSAVGKNVPHVAPADRTRVERLGHPGYSVVHVAVHYGFFDVPDLPAALAEAAASDSALEDVDLDRASWFVSRATLSREEDLPGMARWRKRLFITLAHNAADPARTFALPADRTVVMGTALEI